ncbi:MAG TPA: HIRAN domain-containing protein [Kofleriaceae bacterium]|nr:HIRAN domain-containing protein [Kofleriaceae bacterium]
MTIDHLFVIWSAPSDGGRHIVGHLTRQRMDSTFYFWYEADLSAAVAKGFTFLPAFPEHRRIDVPYEARYLFATFADRIPSSQRTDAGRMLESWGVKHPDDQFEALAKSGGLRATDRIELAEYRPVDDPLIEPLEFRVAGMKHVPSDSRSALVVGATLKFERERSNPHDPYATIVARTADGMRAGYVPRQYSAMIANLLDRGVELDGVAIRELVLPDDAPRWVVRTTRAGQP